MKYQMINKELGIASCSIADLTMEQTQHFLKQWEPDASIGELTLFYDKKSDLIVLNRDNKNYTLYLDTAEGYLSIDKEKRNRVEKEAPEGMKETIQVLENCIRYRSNGREIGRALKNIIDPLYRPVLNDIFDCSDKAGAMCIAFRYGMMCGKREERARRKAGALDAAV